MLAYWDGPIMPRGTPSLSRSLLRAHHRSSRSWKTLVPLVADRVYRLAKGSLSWDCSHDIQPSCGGKKRSSPVRSFVIACLWRATDSKTFAPWSILRNRRSSSHGWSKSRVDVVLHAQDGKKMGQDKQKLINVQVHDFVVLA